MTGKNWGLIRETAGKADLRQIPVPELQDTYILVKVVTIALNPTDWTTLDAPGASGSLVGCDYAGVVEEVGSAVQRKFSKGDRIAGFAHGGNDANFQHGAFASYIVVKGDVQFHIPDNVTFEAACTFGVGILTAGYALYKVLQLPFPHSPLPDAHKTVLIHGGSSSTGTQAIQLAKRSGYRVVTTCSPKNNDLLIKRGADVTLDYRSPDIVQQILDATHNDLSLVFDCVSTAETAKLCGEVIGPSGGIYCALLVVRCPRDDVKSIDFLVYSISGESYIFEDEHYLADPGFFAHGAKFAELVDEMWANGELQPHPQRVLPGGLQGALEGMKVMKEGRYSGEKLIYHLDEARRE